MKCRISIKASGASHFIRFGVQRAEFVGESTAAPSIAAWNALFGRNQRHSAPFVAPGHHFRRFFHQRGTFSQRGPENQSLAAVGAVKEQSKHDVDDDDYVDDDYVDDDDDGGDDDVDCNDGVKFGITEEAIDKVGRGFVANFRSIEEADNSSRRLQSSSNRISQVSHGE